MWPGRQQGGPQFRVNRHADPSFDFNTRPESVPELDLLALTFAIVRLIRRCFRNLSSLFRDMAV
ncbi:hypothetical protein K443DRAFT_679640 [Laccaria amethystina LaAM-08-1]|uniref:Uncharacterized protein n=1 Tax=Laccaria amethystina LaAM-08-1 TaxID=1095629 RepID=A0A0C9X4D3_9AGAR|nr:hypothetical protein K443DRAFT_679640 [Laccaria amethystina LaAM-08-1]